MFRNCKRWENHCPSSTIFVIWTSQVAISGKEPTRQCRRFKRCMYNTWVGMISWRRKLQPTPVFLGFPGGSVGKEFACNAWDLGSIPGLGRSPGEGKGYPLQYSGLENSMDCTVHGVAKRWTQLNDFQITSILTWRIPWTEEPGGLRSIGSQRVRHDICICYTTVSLPTLRVLYLLTRKK